MDGGRERQEEITGIVNIETTWRERTGRDISRERAGASILGGSGSRPLQILGRRVVGVAGYLGVSWTGREILLYLIIYRKYMYVRKW